MEHWVEIENYPNYIVSNEGQVARQRIGRLRILQPQRNRGGYWTVNLYNEKGMSTKTIHRLVAQAFFDPDLFYLQLNHKDGNKANNYLSNLEFVTSKENHKHAFETGLRFHGKPIAVRCVDTGEEFNSMAEASERTGVHRGNISAIIRGRWKVVNGLHFELIE